jgi:putative nucleotidyltransferase-like protein
VRASLDSVERDTPSGYGPPGSLSVPAVHVGDEASRLVFRLARADTIALGALDLEAIGDWLRVLQLSIDESAVVVLRDYLASQQWRGVPPDVQQCLAMLALDREFRMRLLASRLEESLAALNAVGIETMLLKGGALASTVYGSFAARPMRDIDILVKPDRADAAKALMLDLGWAPDPELPGDESYATHHHLPPLRDTGASGMRLEIHRALAPAGHPFRFSDEEIWSEARRARVGRAHALVMHPVHHAAHIAMHFAWSHMLKMGAWQAFRDLSTMAAARLFEWDDLAPLAARWGASSCCYWTLQLAVELSNLWVPASLLSALRPALPRVVHAPLARHLAHGVLRTGGGCPSVRLDHALWALAMQPVRDGHGATRPWSVSHDLNVARSEQTPVTTARISSSAFRRLRHSARYLSDLIAHRALAATASD